MSVGARLGILGGTLDPDSLRPHRRRRRGARRARPRPRARPAVARSAAPRRPAARVAVPPVRDGGAGGERRRRPRGQRRRAAARRGRRTPPTRWTGCTRAGSSASQIFFITGADAFAEIETWKRYPEVLDLANFVVVSRPGLRGRGAARRGCRRSRIACAPAGATPRRGTATPLIYLLDAPTPDVSSTDDPRRGCARGEPIAGLVPPLVERTSVSIVSTARIARLTPRQITCMAKTERKRPTHREEDA